MKKRKELDALLTMANGKKNGKSKRAKEGHELLRLDSESNSSDNDELFLAPKKTVIRRPKPCQCCAMCVPLVMFVLTMGCMVITGGLIWMHFNLKQDLDNLRKSLEKVEIKADSATSQQSTIGSLESEMEKLSSIPSKVDIADIKISHLNKSLSDVQTRQDQLDNLKSRIEALERKTSSTSGADLEQNVAQLGSEIQDLKGKHDEQEKTIAGHETKITELTNEVNTLKSQVAILENPPTTPPAPEVAPPTTHSSATTRHQTSEGSGSSAPTGPQLIEVKEDITKLWAAVHEVQSVTANLSREHDEVIASLTEIRQRLPNGTITPSGVPSLPGQSSPAPQSIQAGQFDLAQMRADIELLKEEYNKSISSMPVTDVIPAGESSSLNATELQSIIDKISRIEEQVKELNSPDSGPNLLNKNVTDNMQMLFERSLQQFKDENLADVTALRTDIDNVQKELEATTTFDVEIDTRILALQDQISELKQVCSVCSAGGSSTTAQAESVPIQNPPLTTAPAESQPVTSAPERTSDGSR